MLTNFAPNGAFKCGNLSKHSPIEVPLSLISKVFVHKFFNFSSSSIETTSNSDKSISSTSVFCFLVFFLSASSYSLAPFWIFWIHWLLDCTVFQRVVLIRLSSTISQFPQLHKVRVFAMHKTFCSRILWTKRYSHWQIKIILKLFSSFRFSYIVSRNFSFKCINIQIHLTLMWYKCRDEAEAFTSHTSGHQTFWPWVVYYFSWSPVESTLKTEFCRGQGEVRPTFAKPRRSRGFCCSGRALETNLK